jgi:hypothetical protein
MLSILFLTVLLSSCAMTMNGTRQQIHVTGGPEDKTVRLKTPDGTYEIENGSSTFLLTRSQSDIPVTVICPNGKKKEDIIPTKFDMLWGGLGNVLNGGIGWFIDPFSPEGYKIDNFSLARFCNGKGDLEAKNKK